MSLCTFIYTVCSGSRRSDEGKEALGRLWSASCLRQPLQRLRSSCRHAVYTCDAASLCHGCVLPEVYGGESWLGSHEAAYRAQAARGCLRGDALHQEALFLDVPYHGKPEVEGCGQVRLFRTQGDGASACLCKQVFFVHIYIYRPLVHALPEAPRLLMSGCSPCLWRLQF